MNKKANINSLEDLKKLLTSKSVPEVIYHHILFKEAVCLNGDSDLIYDLKKALSEYFKVHIRELEIVGSAKIGICMNRFSTRYGKKFGEESDIDLVVVSSELFDRAWHELLKFELSSKASTQIGSERLRQSYKTIPNGIISPERLPENLNFSKIWWKIFSELSNQNKYHKKKIRGRLFKDWWFVEKYYSIELAKLSNV